MKIGYFIHADLTGFRRPDPIANATNQGRVKEIDVLWLSDKNEALWEFEVENTTGVSEAIVRGSNLTGDVTRIIVMPDERKTVLERKLAEPLIDEAVKQMKWGVVFYDTLWAYHERFKRKKSIAIEDFEKIVIPFSKLHKIASPGGKLSAYSAPEESSLTKWL